MQRALPAILYNTPESFFSDTKTELSRVGEQLFARLSQIPGLKPLLPQGAFTFSRFCSPLPMLIL